MSTNEEYTLNQSTIDGLDRLTTQEQSILSELQSLSDKCMEAGIPCFLSAKFKSCPDPTAAWYFGSSEEEAYKTFVTDLAPMMLFLTSEITQTKIVSSNPKTDEVVYSVEPTETPDRG